MSKKFKLGFMVGRFQMLHKGHESLINEGLELCERFVILLGNSEESRTKNNPFTFEERKEMIKTIFGDKVEVYPLISIGIGYVPAWGNYVMNTVKFYCGDYPDFVLRGSDDGRTQWIDKEKYNNLTEYIINRNIIPISATQVRRDLADLPYVESMDSEEHATILYNRIRDLLSDKYSDEQLHKYAEILENVKYSDTQEVF